jgi:hypothetical protein
LAISTRSGKSGHADATHLTDMNLLLRLIRRLRPSPERFAAAAALYDNTPMLQLRVAQTDDR